MEAIGVNPIKLNAIGLDPIRMNAVKLGVPGASSASVKPYISPKVLASLKMVCVAYGKSNSDPDRAVIRNLVDPDNPLVAKNFSFSGNSGYGLYPEYVKANDGVIVESISPGKFIVNNATYSGTYCITLSDIDKPYKVKWKSNVDNFVGNVYWDVATGEANILTKNLGREGEFIAQPIGDLKTETGKYMFYQNKNTIVEWEICPVYEGALVADGVNDEVTSTKTMAEMLSDSNECTVLSMIVNLGSYPLLCNSNYSALNAYNIRNTLEPDGVISILGYTDNNGKVSNINSVMGDKNSIKVIDKLNYDSEFTFIPTGYYKSYYKTAWYWTIIANKVLTTDEINQVIAYFNLDRCVKPDVYCNIRRQGLSNDTPDAEWYLKDLTGNGHDMQLFNLAKTEESGVNSAGSLCFDGVNDYGLADNLPIYKDYTVIADREILGSAGGGVASKGQESIYGAFVFDFTNEVISFGTPSSKIVDKSRFISYQSKYVNNGTAIDAGGYVDGNKLYIARMLENPRFTNLALYAFLLFPYSLSPFLIERQLKRKRLGTLYPGMVEFRPIITSNVPFKSVRYYRLADSGSGWEEINAGDYAYIGKLVLIRIETESEEDKITSVSSKQIESIDISGSNGIYNITGWITAKVPQEISIYISAYISLISNATMISNETLIKNE